MIPTCSNIELATLNLGSMRLSDCGGHATNASPFGLHVRGARDAHLQRPIAASTTSQYMCNLVVCSGAVVNYFNPSHPSLWHARKLTVIPRPLLSSSSSTPKTHCLFRYLFEHLQNPATISQS